MNDIVFKAAIREDIPTICKFRVTQLSRGGTVEVPDIDAELKAFQTSASMTTQFIRFSPSRMAKP